MSDRQARIAEILAAAPVVPVLTIEERVVAVPLARALIAGGLTAIEVTLRTAAALDCIRAIAGEVEAANVGAGTVLDPAQYEAAEKAGARFVVSPGVTDRLLAAAANSAVPFLPGAVTAGEAMRLLDRGYRHLKFFPAEPAGGVSYLRSLSAPLPSVRFCPTGGVGPKNARDYLSLPNVICVGGSWVAPPEAIAGGDWHRITALSREAVALKIA